VFPVGTGAEIVFSVAALRRVGVDAVL